MQTNTRPWRKSSHSHLGGTDGFDCVELAPLRGGARGIRDSKQGDRGQVIQLSRQGLRSLLGAVSRTM